MIMIGVVRLGNEPVVRFTGDNKPVLDLSLAFNYGKKGSDGKRPTQWVNATLWGDRAEKIVSYLHKGKQLFVQLADVHIDTYTKKDGTTATSLQGRVTEIELIGDRTESEKTNAPAGNSNDCPF